MIESSRLNLNNGTIIMVVDCCTGHGVKLKSYKIRMSVIPFSDFRDTYVKVKSN